MRTSAQATAPEKALESRGPSREMATLLTGRLGAASCCWAPLARRALTSMAAWTPHAERRPFQQPNRRRDDQLLPRMPPAVPEVIGQPFVQAWLSAWGEPRAGIAPLRADIWTLPLRTDIVHRVVTWQRACMRQGTSKTKGRHEVRGGGRKPRPQKGSGRSRQGSIRSPLFVGGGHAHPKRPRDFSYKLNLKVQSLGIKTALSDKWRRGALIVMRDYALASTEQRPTGMARRTAALSAQLSQELSALGIDLSRQRGACARAARRRALLTLRVPALAALALRLRWLCGRPSGWLRARSN